MHLILYGEVLTPDKIVGNGMYRDVPGMYFDCHTFVELGRSYESILTLNRFVTTPKLYSLHLVGRGGGDSKNQNCTTHDVFPLPVAPIIALSPGSKTPLKR